MEGPVLTIKELGKTYGTGPYAVEALTSVNLEVFRNEFVSIIGPSGCGKSTLLEIAAGLIPESQGEVYLLGERIKGPHPNAGIVFQQDSVFPWRTTLENVEFGLQMRGAPKGERRKKCLEIVELVGLSGFENRYPAELSGGMRQRVAIARALAMELQILLMDEPFGALDEQTRIILGEELLHIQDKIGQTILFVTHNINEAVQLSDRVVVITARPGKIKEIFYIDLMRPRDSSVIASEQFGKLVGKIWLSLREESLKGFKREYQT